MLCKFYSLTKCIITECCDYTFLELLLLFAQFRLIHRNCITNFYVTEDTLGFRAVTAIFSKDRSALLSFVNEHIGCGLWFETFTVLSDKSLVGEHTSVSFGFL